MNKAQKTKLITLIFAAVILSGAAYTSTISHIIFTPYTGYSITKQETDPGTAPFTGADGEDVDITGEKTVTRYDLIPGTPEPRISKIIKYFSDIASARNGWTFLYTEHTLYMGFSEPSEIEYWVKIYVDSEYYDTVVVTRSTGNNKAQLFGKVKQSVPSKAAPQPGGSGSSDVTPEKFKPKEPSEDTVMENTSVAGPSLPGSVSVASNEDEESSGTQSSQENSGSSSENNQTPGIEITSPNPGIILFAGDPMDIGWTAVNVSGMVQIGYEWKPGNTNNRAFENIAMHIPASNGGYHFTIPARMNSRLQDDLVFVVRSQDRPDQIKDTLNVRIYPHVDLQMVPTTRISQVFVKRAFIRVWKSILKLNLDFINHGIDDLDKISIRIQIFNQRTDQLIVQDTVYKSGYFIPGTIHSAELRLAVSKRNIFTITDSQSHNCNTDCLDAGDYRIVIDLVNDLEPDELHYNNTKILFMHFNR